MKILLMIDSLFGNPYVEMNEDIIRHILVAGNQKQSTKVVTY